MTVGKPDRKRNLPLGIRQGQGGAEERTRSRGRESGSRSVHFGGLIEDVTVRGFKEDTRRDDIRHVRAFAAFIGRSPDTATAEELRLLQPHQRQSGLQPPSSNSAVSALMEAVASQPTPTRCG
jgi:hypothetical protein